MEDTDDDVRDWATFGLGVSTGDSPQIREAFRRSLNDTFLDVRQEAIWGLARRKDPEGLLLLLEQLEAHVWAAGDEWACMWNSGTASWHPGRGFAQRAAPGSWSL